MKTTNQSGSIVAYILIISLTSIVILTGLLQQVTVTFNDTNDRYYNKIAEEAAQAGISYALSCIEKAGRQSIPWSGYLTLARQCSGPNYIPAKTQDVYVDPGGSFKTRFIVHSSTTGVTLNESSVEITAIGYTELLTPDGSGTVRKRYTVQQKQTVVWDPGLVAQSTSSGTQRTCGILSGNIWCWGRNQVGQLGNNTNTDSLTPVRLYRQPSGIGSKKAEQIVSGNYSNCAIFETDEVYCWGENGRGQLGQGGSTTDSNVPLKVNGLPTNFVPRQLAAAYNTFCVLGNRTSPSQVGQVWCWGDDRVGQLGNGPTNDGGFSATPVQIAGPGVGTITNNQLGTLSVKALSYGGAFSETMCAIAASNENAYCWGSNNMGQLGLGGTSDWNTPRRVNTGPSSALNGKKVIKIAVDGKTHPVAAPSGNDNEAHACALAYTTTVSDAQVYCWGSNRYNSLGDKDLHNGSPPPPDYSGYAIVSGVDTPTVAPGSTLKTGMIKSDIAVSGSGVCVLARGAGTQVAQNRAHCWGRRDTRGANDPPGPTFAEAKIATDADNVFATNQVSGLTGGAYRICAIAQQRIHCWGANDVGQIGDGTSGNVVVQPTPATFLPLDPSRTLY